MRGSCETLLLGLPLLANTHLGRAVPAQRIIGFVQVRQSCGQHLWISGRHIGVVFLDQTNPRLTDCGKIISRRNAEDLEGFSRGNTGHGGLQR